MTIRSQSLFLFTKELILATKRGGDIRKWRGMDSIFRNCYLIQNVSNLPILPQATSLTNFRTYMTFTHKKCYSTLSNLGVQHDRFLLKFSLAQRAHSFEGHNVVVKRFYARNVADPSFELKTENDVLKFSFGMPDVKSDASTNAKNIKAKRIKMSKKRKLNELRFYRLKAKKKMKSPNPEVRIRYKLEKAKRKEAWLIEKLMKFEVPTAPSETYDPEILTEEEKFYLKRTGEKKKHYVPVGRRGVFGGVVLNMHLHWKKHETVKVVCKPCRPGQIHEYAEELARLSKGVLIDIKPNNTIIFYRGKNYVQPEVMSPPDTLSKNKALEKYKFEQSLEHTSEFIEKLEKELDEYHKHLAQYRKRKEDTQASVINTC